jgi:photosynthetic reaction center H subunit
MYSAAIIGNLDIAQLLVWVFFIFFIGLVLYLRREDKREGYPLKDPAGGPDAVGFPGMPEPKTFVVMGGGTTTAPHAEWRGDLAARRLENYPGSPLVPAPDVGGETIGPGAYPPRRDAPLIYAPGKIQMLPLRTLEGWSLAEGDPDPRGMTVVGSDGVAAGLVTDLWIDRSVKILRYLEVELSTPEPRRILLPIYYSDIRRRHGRVRVAALSAARLAEAPSLSRPDTITALEEDQVNAFYAGGQFLQREARARTRA